MNKTWPEDGLLKTKAMAEREGFNLAIFAISA
jgi:hypothetical protein